MASPSEQSADAPVESPTAPQVDPRGGLWSVSFVALVVTQFLVALNDNMFRWLLIPIGKELVGPELALAAGALVFLLPFVVLAAPAGYLTDRFSKRNVMIGAKVAEIVVMALGVLVILSGHFYVMLFVLFLMGAQSTMFSPSKYGSIPEIVREDRISAANGVIGMTTMMAIILGTVAGNFLYAWTTPPSILVVHQQASEQERLGELVHSLGFRTKKAESTEEALDSIRSGAPKLVLLDDRLPDRNSVEAATEIHKIAGTVSVLLMTADRDLLEAGPAGEAETAKAGRAGPDLCLAKPVGLNQLKPAVEKLAGPGEPAVIGRSLLPGQFRWWRSAAALIGVAVVGWIASLFIGRLRPSNPQRRFPRNPVGQTGRDLAALVANRPLLLAALGSTYFWSLGCLAQMNVDWFARPELVTDQQHVGPLLGVLTLGIGIGSVLAGLWSRGKIELGLVPFGALGMALFSMLLFTVPAGEGSPWSGPYYWASFWLLTLGLSAGLYDIPLLAFLQHRSPKESRGRILAAYNFMAFSGMMLASGIFWLLARKLDLSGRHIWLVAGIATLPICLYIFWLVFDRVAYVLVGAFFRTLYRVRLYGLENVPEKTGAMLIPNHVTWIDGLLLLYYCPRPLRMVTHKDYILPGRVGQRLARDYGIIPIVPGRKSVVRSIRTAREALRQGDLVCVFPEGGLSRTGQLNPFHPGFLTMLKGTDAPVIPVHLGGLWGSIFSFEGGKWFWKWPRRLPYPVSIRFGRPVHHVTDPHQVRQAVLEMETEAMDENKQESRKMIPPRRFLRMCRRNLRRPKVADSTGTELTGAALLTRALILRRLLRREVLASDEKHVGVLLPPSVGAVVVNAAVSIDARVAVNLNYTVSSDVMNACIDRAEIRHVLTSKSVMQKLNLQIDAEVVYLDDFKEKVTLADKLAAATATWLLPVGLLERRFGLTKLDPDDLLTLIFTSGSTGHPKGVMLTHHNVGSNVEAFAQIVHIKRDDVLAGILPFFHSFGYTVTLWSVLNLDAKGVYHYSPLEARQVGKLCKKHGGTLLIATPTFLRSYTRRCQPEDFASLEVVVTGAEKLPSELADAFEKKFGIRPLEGYGTTELSPVVSCNIPPTRLSGTFQLGAKEGTVGRPVPGVSAKVVHLETGEELGVDTPGMLLIRGPNVMKGYFGQPELTEEVIRDGWYTTGDVAMIDEEGFIRITGRQSRFSKIGGEMVPHLRIEEVLEEILALGEEELTLAVTAVPDVKKGERLVILHTGLEQPAEEICRKMADAGLPPIWIPSPDSFLQVDAIPVLGTGKLDLRRARQLAEEKMSSRS